MNDYSAIVPQLLARTLLSYREYAVMPRLANRDYAEEGADYGDTIDVPVSNAVQVQDVIPGHEPVAANPTTYGKVQIPLNKWKSANFYLTDNDLVRLNANAKVLPTQTFEAARAIANQINGDIHAHYKGVYSAVGTAGTTPFGTTMDAINAREALNANRAPLDPRYGVIDTKAEAKALALSEFAHAEKSGSDDVVIRGELGEKFGINWVLDHAVAYHTAGTAGGASGDDMVVASAVAAGATTVPVQANVAGSAGTLVEGDILTFAGSDQTYTVVEGVSVSDGAAINVKVAPAVVDPLAGGEVATKAASHRANLVFHRDAFAFVNRPLTERTGGLSLGSIIERATDPATGLSMRMEVSRQHKQVKWELDVLYGSQLIRPEAAVRLMG